MTEILRQRFTPGDYLAMAKDCRRRIDPDAICHRGICTVDKCGRCGRLERAAQAHEEAASTLLVVDQLRERLRHIRALSSRED